MADLYRSAARIGQVGVLDIGPHDCRELAVAVNAAAPTALRAEANVIRCRTTGCGHALARLGDAGGVYPLVPTNYYERGCVILVCPVCREKRKVQLKDRAA